MKPDVDKKHKLTVIVPCFNEEECIESCLKSVLWADEILVVDSFSTDNTLKIAEKYAHRILEHEYINSAAQKNWAIPQAKHEWILILDSDEQVSPELKEEIEELIKQGPGKDGYWIFRNNYLFGKRIRFSGWGKDSLLRLFKRSIARYEVKSVHAEIQLEHTGILKHRLEHRSVSSITKWVNKINRYSSWKAEDKFNSRTSLVYLQLILRPPLRFIKDFVFRLGLLDGWRGFLIAVMSSYAEFVMSAKVISLRFEKRQF
jgi:glycosyltransferase involved in cell wall biosynthesis